MRLARSVSVITLLALAPAVAAAQSQDPVKLAERLNKKAMEDYDLLEFESARQTLQSALNKLREDGQDETRTAAKVYVSLGMVYISGFKDRSRGVQQFVEAFVGVDDAALHAGLQHAIAVGDRAEDGVAGHTRATAGQRLEDSRFENDMASFGQPLKLEGADDTLGCGDFMIYAVESVNIALLIAVEIAP